MTGDTPDTPSEAPAPAHRRKRGRVLIRFGRSQDGATAIEFAFLATPFLMLLAAIFETAVMFWTSQVLEEAVNQTARTLVTGQSRAIYTGSTNAANAAAFRDAVCANAPLLIDCTRVVIDVRNYASFALARDGTTGASPISGGILNTNGFTYNQPAAGQIVVVRAVLDYTLFFTQWSSALANIGEGRRALVASSTFRTEPFQ